MLISVLFCFCAMPPSLYYASKKWLYAQYYAQPASFAAVERVSGDESRIKTTVKTILMFLKS